MHAAMQRNASKSAEAVICRLILEYADRLDEALIVAKAAGELARRAKTSSALKTLMEVEGPVHHASDIFRACMIVRQTLPPEAS